MVLRRPIVRLLEPTWTEENGEQLLVLRDREGLIPSPIAVPAVVGLVLSLCDGIRDEAGIAAEVGAQLGQEVPPEAIASMVDQLIAALVLEGPAVDAARTSALESFRAAPRPAALAGAVYPADREELRRTIASFVAPPEPGSRHDGDLRGVIAPHIDYARGGRVYRRAFERAAPALRQADVLVVFGTDHGGSSASITLTRQDFETPFGRFAVDRAAIDAMASVLGDEAFAEELHHRGEHSIELALVWAASHLGDRRPTIVPILCGSFHHFVSGSRHPRTEQRMDAALDALKMATRGRRVVVIAGADLAHVGPAFGDPVGFDAAARDRLREQDEDMLRAAVWGRADAFYDQVAAERDARRICGLPPIYLTLRLLGESTRGEVVDYDQCSADPDGGSLVSVGGVLLW